MEVNRRKADIQIKDNFLCKLISKENFQELVIIRNAPNSTEKTMLSEVLDYLPNGFVYKDETGIGATTLEIRSARNSIIVEPTRITAYSKSLEEKLFYVGGSLISNKKSVRDDEIINYLSDENIKFKKIAVVADSLPRVIKCIEKIPGFEYFLVLDEIDSFQIDSTFRSSMEVCLDIYKLHPEDKRAMLSATRIDFSDTDFDTEPITFIKYNQEIGRNISLIETNSSFLYGAAFDTITKCINENPNDKIFVAFNSVNTSLAISNYLVENKSLNANDIAILCSQNSKDRVGTYYKELHDHQLPAKINFLTSAYFTGFDIKEPYHLISISTVIKPMHTLSDRRLKQIAGRCRVGLLSETILHDFMSSEMKSRKNYTKEEMIEMAETQIKSFECFSLQFAKIPALKMIMDNLSNAMIDNLGKNSLRYTRKLDESIFKISYLNIDANLEGQRIVSDLYSNKKKLYKKLVRDGNTVKYEFITSETKLKVKDATEDNFSKDAEEIIDQIKNDLTLESLTNSALNLRGIKKEIFILYQRYMGMLESNSFLEAISKCTKDKLNIKPFNRLKESVAFFVGNNDSVFKSRIDLYFKKGEIYSIGYIKDRVIKAMIESGFQFAGSQIDTGTKGLQKLKTYKSVYKIQKIKGESVEYRIRNSNPYRLKLLK